jgi:hypothetical protein
LPRIAKLLIGVAAALLAGWVFHGPIGRGEAFASRLEARARAVVTEAELPEIRARIDRAPLARRILMSGPADEFQREGQGYFPGLNDRILGLGGIAAIQWPDEPERKSWPLPLLLETELIVLIAFLAGLGLGRFWSRPRRQGYL